MVHRRETPFVCTQYDGAEIKSSVIRHRTICHEVRWVGLRADFVGMALRQLQERLRSQENVLVACVPKTCCRTFAEGLQDPPRMGQIDVTGRPGTSPSTKSPTAECGIARSKGRCRCISG